MLWDLLDEHAQALIDQDEEKRLRVRALAEASPELLSLMDVAERVHRAYQPVAPSGEFRARLKKKVRRAARWKLWWPNTAQRMLRSYWLWGALASIVSVAGGVGYFLVRRSQTA